MPQETGPFAIVDGAGIIRALGPPRAAGSTPLDVSCIGASLFETLPDLPRRPLAEAIAATVSNGRSSPSRVLLRPEDPFGAYIEVCAGDGEGQVMLRWVKGLEDLARALVADLSGSQTLEAAVRFLAVRLAPARTLGLALAEKGSTELLPLAQAGPWHPSSPPPRWGSGILVALARYGGLACGKGGDDGLSPEERSHLSGPWLSCGLLPPGRAPGALLVVGQSGRAAFGPEAQALLRSVAALVEMALARARLPRGDTQVACDLSIVSSKDAGACGDCWVLHRSVFDTVNALAVAIEAKDPYTEGHVQRVTQYALALGEELGLSEDQLRILQFGALLHDVGKIGVRDDLLNKAGPLDPLEVEEIRAHPLIGERIIRDVDFLQPIRAIVRYHQERYDGSGYPEGLKGDAIPLPARIIAVADAYDSMAADRPYRKSLGERAAVRILRQEAGRQFDPGVVEAFLRIVGAHSGAA